MDVFNIKSLNLLLFVMLSFFIVQCEPKQLKELSFSSNGQLTSISNLALDKDVHLTSNVVDWRKEIIYQVIVDRFADGDPNNNYNVNKQAPAQYHGGDYQGIIDHIDYFKELGVTTLWISPVVQNVENDAGFAGYHGYWTQNFLKVNPHFGDLGKMREMVDILHENGFKVILDIVTNHIGQLFFYDINKNGQPDESVYGCGTMLKWFKEGECDSGIYHLSEYDPDWNPNGIQSWTSLGPSGPAPIIWRHDPINNHEPIMPIEFQNPDWYHKMGRVIAWDSPNPQCFMKCFEYDSQYPNWQSVQSCINNCNSNSFSCSETRLQETDGDFPGGLKDLNTENPDVRDALIKVFEYWIKAGDFDGFRIDTLKHVGSDFWVKFCSSMRNYAAAHGKKKFFQFGEAFDGHDDLIGIYTKPAGTSYDFCKDSSDSPEQGGEIDSVFYFSQKFTVFDGVFKWGAPTRVIENLYKDRQIHFGDQPYKNGAELPPQRVLVNFMSNHDIPRFLFDMPDIAKFHNALAYLYTEDGIPCMYYGTEQEFNGGNDPANREDMIFNTQNSTFKFVKKLIAFRKKYDALTQGDFVIRWSTENSGSEEDAGIFAFERLCGAGQTKGDITVSQWATCKGPDLLVVFNTNGAQSSHTAINGNAMKVSFKPGTKLVDLFSGQGTWTVGNDGTVVVDVPLNSFVVLGAAQ